MKHFTVVINDDLYKKVKVKAALDGKTLKEYLTQLLDNDVRSVDITKVTC